MDAWLSMLLRQLIIYTLPVIISLTVVVWIESRVCRQSVPHPFYAIWWRGLWLPMLAAIAMHRGVIFALPKPLGSGPKSASIRALAHLALCFLGWGIYTLSLAYQPSTGLPPLHLWWAKVLMYFNLCMLFMHLMPLPNLWFGELLRPHIHLHGWGELWLMVPEWVWLVLFAASPISDWLLGGWCIFPVYEWMATQAGNFMAGGR